MNFRIGASALAEILNKAKRAIPGKPIFPATRFIKLTAEDGTIEAIGTDSTLFIGAKSSAEISEEGCILIDPVLSQIAGKAGGTVLTLRTEKDKLFISGYGDTEINLGDDPEDFPIPAKEVPKRELILSDEEISALGISVGSKRDANPRDRSVNLISHEGQSYCLTTEMGFWMSIAVLEVEEELPSALIPFSYLRKAAKIAGEPRIGLGARHATVKGNTTWATFQLNAGLPYPPSAVALETAFILKPDYQELVDALTVSIHFTASAAHLCTLSLMGNILNVESGGSETGNFDKDIEVHNEMEGGFTAKYNAKRLMMALKNVGEANLEFVPHPNFPEHYILRVRKDNIQHLIMPLVVERKE